MQSQTIFGTFSPAPQDANDLPLWVIGNELPESFLEEEVAFGATVGRYFYTSNLTNMWRDITFMQALLRHPEAILPLRSLVKRLKIKVDPIRIRDYFHILSVTDEYLFENQVDTVEQLVTKISRKKMSEPSDLVKNDLDSVFRSFYGVSLGLSA